LQHRLEVRLTTLELTNARGAALAGERPDARTPEIDTGNKGASQTPRSALIFISGLSETIVDQGLDGIARRLGVAIDRNAGTGSAQVTVDFGAPNADLGDGFTVQRGTITRSDSDSVLDVWHLPTASTLTGDFSAANPVRRAVLAAAVLGRSLLKLPRGWRGRTMLARLTHPLRTRTQRSTSAPHTSTRAAKGFTDRSQLLVAGLLLFLLLVYLAGLVVVIAASFVDAPWMPRWASGALLVMTGIGIWKASGVRVVANGAVETNCLFQYLDSAIEPTSFVGGLHSYWSTSPSTTR
jgi:hypothetical protein